MMFTEPLTAKIIKGEKTANDLFRIYGPEECGADGYPFTWHKGEPAVKDLVRALAGHRCVRCGHPFVVGETPGEWSPCDDRCTHGGEIRYAKNRDLNGWYGPINTELSARAIFEKWDEVEARWRVLTVHHLTGVKADLRWWNLAALCQRCHLEIQGRIRMEQVYPYEHSPWFKPYAAGYYAATYLGEDLTREETEARLDELLALELQALAGDGAVGGRNPKGDLPCGPPPVESGAVSGENHVPISPQRERTADV